jgi:hypothetical protein
MLAKIVLNVKPKIEEETVKLLREEIKDLTNLKMFFFVIAFKTSTTYGSLKNK